MTTENLASFSPGIILALCAYGAHFSPDSSLQSTRSWYYAKAIQYLEPVSSISTYLQSSSSSFQDASNDQNSHHNDTSSHHTAASSSTSNNNNNNDNNSDLILNLDLTPLIMRVILSAVAAFINKMSACQKFLKEAADLIGILRLDVEPDKLVAEYERGNGSGSAFSQQIQSLNWIEKEMRRRYYWIVWFNDQSTYQ